MSLPDFRSLGRLYQIAFVKAGQPAPSTAREIREFLPAAIEIVETPISPGGRWVINLICIFGAAALAWSCIGKVEIVAIANGRIIPSDKSKVIQPIEPGVVAKINVHDGDEVRVGDPLIVMDDTAAKADRDKLARELLRVRLDVLRLQTLRKSPDLPIEKISFGSFPADIPPEYLERALEATRAQARSQYAKVGNLEGQIAEKLAESGETDATLVKTKAQIPLLEDETNVREQAMKVEFGNRIAWLETKERLVDQRNAVDVLVEHKKQSDATAAALAQQKDQTIGDYQRQILSDLEPDPKVIAIENVT